MQAIIMAGGEGARLRPLTCERAKPLVPVGNRPVMAYILELLEQHGFTEVHVTLGYQPGAIMDRFGERHGSLSLSYTVEETPLGTAGGVALLRDRLRAPFLVISGDVLTDIDLTALVHFHRERGAIVTMAMAQVANPLEYGVIMTDRDGRIRRFLEKPGWGEVFSDTVNTGIYVLEPEVIRGVPAGRPYDFSRDLFPALLATGAPLYGCVADGYWCDIGDLTAYLQANLDLLRGRLRFPAPPQPRIEGAILEEAVIGSNCRIAPGAQIRQSVLWDGVTVEAGASLQGTVLCDGALVQTNAALYPGSVIGRGGTVGAGATVCPGVRLWPGRVVEEGARADTHLIQAPRQTSRVLRGGAITGILGQDLVPEMAVRAGTAFAGLLGDGPVVVGADPGRVGSLVKQALLCGVMAAGRPALDVGATNSPVTRFAVALAGAAGGLHVRALPDGRVSAAFLGAGGRPLGREEQRRLEQAVSKQEFRRAGPEAVGGVEPFTRAESAYLEQLVAGIDRERIRREAFAVSLEAPGWPLASRWAALLGCRLTADPGADLRARIDPLTAALTLPGVAPAQMLTLEVLLALRGARPMQGEVAVPMTAPQSVDQVLSHAGLRARRVRRDEYEPGDPLALLTALIGWMVRERLTQTAVIARLPRTEVAVLTVPCAWEAKGRVMRRLLEQHQDEAVELIDGLRIQRPDGWVLVLPDAEEPVYRIYAEGAQPFELAAAYGEKVAALIGQG